MLFKQQLINGWLKAIYTQDKVIWWLYILYPLRALVQLITSYRYKRYLNTRDNKSALRRPVWVIGNLTLGGTGKTPTLIAIVKLLRQQGIKPGVISRGFGSKCNYPYMVTSVDNPEQVGDEALLLAGTLCPVVIDPNRLQAAQYILDNCECDLILSDDGLQHYNLPRDLELVVVDNLRQFGNQQQLPMGPLREDMTRLKTVDAVLINHKTAAKGVRQFNSQSPQFNMHLQTCTINSLDNSVSMEINEWLEKYQSRTIHAMAAIGDPNSFYRMLESLGINCITHSFADHHPYSLDDFADVKATDIVIMTEKDAVKCVKYKSRFSLWYIKIHLELEPALQQWLLDKIAQIKSAID
jgi:tetraacyldisaccharide 4'-kinase